MTVLLSLSGGGVLSPTRIAWAELGTFTPFGFSRSSVWLVTVGIESPSVSRTGARSGAALSAPAAITDCQLPWSASATAGGRVDASPAGKRADATPAASAIGSRPLTRVVLRVALTGKPSCCAAFSSFALAPATGAAPGTESELSSAFREQPARASAARRAAQRGVRGTAREGNERRLTAEPTGSIRSLIDWSVSPLELFLTAEA